MPELRQEYLDILEKREWSVSGYTDDGRVELEWWSPAGEDFLVCVNVENFPDEILDYSDDFDPDEHIESTTFRTPQQSVSRNSAAICCRGLARSRPRGAGRFSALSRKPTSP